MFREQTLKVAKSPVTIYDKSLLRTIVFHGMQNLAVSAEFTYFHGTLRNLVLAGDESSNTAHFGRFTCHR